MKEKLTDVSDSIKKLENLCLTIEQSKELEGLGVDFSNASLAFIDYNDDCHEYELVPFIKIGAYDIIPTLSNTEMISMMPPSSDDVENNIITSWIIRTEKGYKVTYQEFNTKIKFSCEERLLRDGLFKTIKWLKQNKLI